MPSLSERFSFGCPLDDVREILSVRPASWLDPFVRIASHEGDALAARLDGSDPSFPQNGERTVVVDLGEFEPLPGDPGTLVVGFRWEAIGYRTLRSIEGRIVLRPVGRTVTAVEMHASYEPHQWTDGAMVVDGNVTSLAARATVRNLLSNLRSAVEEAVRPQARF